MNRRIIVAAISAVVLGLVLTGSGLGGLSMGAPNKWDNIQVGVTYRLYQPGKTLHKKLNKLKTVSCGKGKEVWVAATYGTYKGVLNSSTTGFALYEGHPICSDPGESTPLKSVHPKIAGAKGSVYVGVYCDPAKTCGISKGYKNGFTVQWTMKPSKPYKKTTQMQLDSAHLKWSQVLTILSHLKKVG